MLVQLLATQAPTTPQPTTPPTKVPTTTPSMSRPTTVPTDTSLSPTTAPTETTVTPREDFTGALWFYLNFDEGNSNSSPAGTRAAGNPRGSPQFRSHDQESSVRGTGYMHLAAHYNSYIDMGNSNLGQPSSMSLAAWVRTTNPNGYHRAIIHRQSSFSLQTKNTNLAYYCWCSPLSYITDQSINDGTWHHVASTMADNTLIMYLDGVAVSSTSIGMGAGGGHVLVGRGAGGTAEGWFGDIDEAAMWIDRVLTAEEVSSIYQHGIGT